MVLDRGTLRRPVESVRRRATHAAVNAAVIHSTDWQRQSVPQLAAVAAVITAGLPTYLVDEASATARRLSGRDRVALLAAIPPDLVDAVRVVWRERRQLSALLRRAASGDDRRRAGGGDVLAVWMGGPDADVGGSVTHISGILRAFRQQDRRVGLVTSSAPPSQLAAAVDEVEITAPISSGARLTADVARLAENRAILAAGHRLASRLNPAFVYQRHRAFTVAGVELADAVGAPLVLEWNASEVWARWNWESSTPVDAFLRSLLLSMERTAATHADLVVAISTNAAQMALDAGACAERVAMVPNGVDLDEIDAAIGSASRPTNSAPIIGWVGSFGPWHGAPVLIRALALMRPDARLVLIGDGVERSECEQLARALNVDARIEWTGRIPHQQAVQRLADCDVLASPHVPIPGQPFFGSPTKLFEYMAIGRPIVASRLDQIGEVLSDRRNARLVPPGDPDALAVAIESVLDSADRGAGLGSAARQEAERSHSWARRADAVVSSLASAHTR
jgi:glycosyltransferase involved in cell wall biosynthesis